MRSQSAHLEKQDKIYENIADFFSSRPKSAAIYKTNDGERWLLSVSDKANQLSFDYYYGRLKKMT